MNQNPFLSNQSIPTPQPQPQPMPSPQPAPFMEQTPYSPQEMNDFMRYRMAYPEIYYKCQPFVMMACDQMDTYSSEIPTQVMIERMSDTIYDDVCRMYPDMVEYAGCAGKKDDTDPPQGFMARDRDRDRDMFEHHFRRRGPFRDFIDFLLLSELFRRRRRFF